MRSFPIITHTCDILPDQTARLEIIQRDKSHLASLDWYHRVLSQGGQSASASQKIAHSYYFRCNACSNCHTVRLDLQHSHLSQRMFVRIADDANTVDMQTSSSPSYTEHARLFRQHAKNRVSHWVNEDLERYTQRERIQGLLNNTHALEFRRRSDRTLVGAVLYDMLPETAHRPRSAYGQCNYYMPDDPTRESPGIIQFARAAAWLSNQGFAYLYLGIWTESASIYHYKSRFKPEVFDNGEWVKWDDFQKRQALRIALVP